MTSVRHGSDNGLAPGCTWFPSACRTCRPSPGPRRSLAYSFAISTVGSRPAPNKPLNQMLLASAKQSIFPLDQMMERVWSPK